MIQGTVNRKNLFACLSCSYQLSILCRAGSQSGCRLITRTTTNADPKLFVHKNCTCTGPETMGETYLMSDTTYFCIFCCVQNPHPCDGQVEHVSSHPTEILVPLTIYTSYACVIAKTAISSSVMRERKKKT